MKLKHAIFTPVFATGHTEHGRRGLNFGTDYFDSFEYSQYSRGDDITV